MLENGGGFVAQRSGAVIGTALCWQFGQHCGTVGLVIVSPQEQGRGVGRQLMELALEALGSRTVFLYATLDGQPSRSTRSSASTAAAPSISTEARLVASTQSCHRPATSCARRQIVFCQHSSNWRLAQADSIVARSCHHDHSSPGSGISRQRASTCSFCLPVSFRTKTYCGCSIIRYRTTSAGSAISKMRRRRMRLRMWSSSSSHGPPTSLR